MGRMTDLTGRQYGDLTVTARTDERKNGYVLYRCRCRCGNETLCSSRALKNGWSTSCGCIAPAPRYRDITGKRFGKLLVINTDREYDSSGRLLWNCVCDCGNTIAVPGPQLNNGYRRSCGCLSRPPRKDWIGKKFGVLTVVAYDGKRDKKHFWRCRCTCGNEISVSQSNLKAGHTTSCGCKKVEILQMQFVDGTSIERIASRRPSKNNTSGVRGVYRSARSGKWCAQITFKGKTKYLGSYDSLEDAVKARQRGEELFDDFLENYWRGKTEQDEAAYAEERDAAYL